MNLLMNTMPIAEARLSRMPRDTLMLEAAGPGMTETTRI